MPARLALSAAELQARFDKQREQAKVRMRRLRERRAATSRNASAVRVTNTAPGGDGDAHPPTPPVSSLSLLERKKIEHPLSTFVDRGYKHDARFWELLKAKYPALDLELEVLKLAEWLDEPRNAERKCNKAFVSNWMSRADADRQQRAASAAPPRPVPYQAPAPGRPPDPDPVLPADVTLERIDPRVAQRALLEAKRLTLPEKLALAKNGRAH